MTSVTGQGVEGDNQLPRRCVHPGCGSVQLPVLGLFVCKTGCGRFTVPVTPTALIAWPGVEERIIRSRRWHSLLGVEGN